MVAVTLQTVWHKVCDLAVALRATPTISDLNMLAPAEVTPDNQISKALNELDSGGGGISSHPLQLFTRLQMALSVMPQPEADPAQWQRLMTLAARAEAAHFDIVAWTRSRFPGYPTIRVPHLVRETPVTTEDFSYRYPWRRQDVGGGLQYQPRPSTIHATGSRDENDVTRAAVALPKEFASTEEWSAFAEAGSDLPDEARAQLRGARFDLRRLLTDEQIDNYEPVRALPRYEYRKHCLGQVIDGLTGDARSYAEKFDRLNNLVDLAVVDVLAQLVRFGPLVEVRPESVEFDDVDEEICRLRLDDDGQHVWLHPGRLVSVDHPLAPAAVRIEGMTFAFDHEVAHLQLTGRSLPDADPLLAFS